MKVNFKRVATAALAVAMSLSLSVSAFAAEPTDVPNGSLTVTGDQLAGKYVYAIQMFEAHALDHGPEENPQYTYDSYTLNEKWLPFFEDEENISKQEWVAAGVIAGTDDTIEDYSDAAVAYVEWLADENQKQKLMTFANNAKKWAESKKVFERTYGADDQASVLQDVEVNSAWRNYAYAQKAAEVSADETKGTTTFESLNTGYYLVYPEGGSTGKAGQTQGVYTQDARGTDAMLINIPTNEERTTWNIKSTYPTVDKTVDTDNDGNGEAADNGSAQVGDTVTFTLKSTVPDMSDYQNFYFAFNDTMSEGLEFVKKGAEVEVTDVTVTIGGDPVDTTYYTVSLTGNELKVVFNNLKDVTGAEVGETIVVTYKAMITEAAATTTNPVTNTVKVEYSNDPDSEGHGTSTPDESKVYTYDIDVNKWADDVVGGKTGSLAGAKFVLSTSETLTGEDDASVIKLINTDSGIGNAYRVAKPGEASAMTSFITTDSGDITISGLEGSAAPGTTYYLHEIEAPDGYNKLKAPVEIVIKITDMDTGDATITVNGVDATGIEGNVIDVENKKGIELPETGSIGTIGLTALGVVVVVAGLFAFPRKKKTRQD